MPGSVAKRGVRRTLEIGSTWDGMPLEPSERASVTLSRCGAELRVEVSSPFYGDPPPSAPPGSVARLWEFEVVELFLLGSRERYLELEFGPHGHYLALALQGRRSVRESGMALHYEAEIRGRQWRGTARLPVSWVPEGMRRGNAYAIHGVGEARRYLARWAPGGEAPDFHRLEGFGEIQI